MRSTYILVIKKPPVGGFVVVKDHRHLVISIFSVMRLRIFDDFVEVYFEAIVIIYIGHIDGSS